MEQQRLNPLIDGDIMVYRCGFAADSQAKRDHVPEGATKEQAAEILAGIDYETWALANVKTLLENITTGVFPLHTYYNLYLTGAGNFREQLATILPYKGNRDELHKPKYYKQIKQYMIETWGAKVVDDMEADDAIGIAQFAAKDRDTCIVSIDKDLNNIPGWHFNFVKDSLYYVTLQEANNNFLLQMVEGDRTDNIPGIYGLGPKYCQKLLAECGEDTVLLRNRIAELYKAHYHENWVEAFNEVAALLWILREENKPCPFMFVEE